MRQLGALALVLAACGGSAAPATTTDPRADGAREFAFSAGRALEGTRFAAMSSGDLADLVMGLCAESGSVIADIEAAVAATGAAGDRGDDAILAEVLTAGVVEVCPERAAADISAAFLASVGLAVETGAGVEVGDSDALNAGLSACLTLDQGTPEDAIVTIAAGLFHVEATAEELFAGAITTGEGVTVGAVLAAAVSFLCPEHAARVQEYLGSITADSDA
jgi:hypothetical protein